MGDSKKDKDSIKKIKEEMQKLLENEKLDDAKMAEMQAKLDTMSPDPFKDVNANYEEWKKNNQWHAPTEPPVITPPPGIECPEGWHFDTVLGKCIPDAIISQPPEELQKDTYGINKIFADKEGGALILSDKFEESEFTRNYASGAPSENSYECEYKDSNKLENEEVTFYCQINGFKKETDTMSVKLLGNKHSDGSKDKWLIFQVQTDGGNEENFQIEDPHPKNTDNHQPTKFTIGETIVGKAIGFKAITYIDEAGKRHAETWLDFPTTLESPANNWRKYIDIPDVEKLNKGFLNATNGGALLRIDGTKKGDKPTTKFMSIREIIPVEGGSTIPPTPPVEQPPVTEIPPPVTPPSTTTTGNVIYDSNVQGKWNNSNARIVTGMDPDCPKVFTGACGLEMHASGNPTLVLDGRGNAELQCEPGHGRFYVDVCNYNSMLEYEVNFLDGSVENNTLNLRSRHQEGEPPENRVGGIQAKLDLKNYDFKTEIFHNEHENSSGDKPLPKPLSLNTWYKVKYTVKDVGTDLYQGMELDYNDGKGYVKVGEQTIKSPNKVYMEKDKIMARSYFWIRMNNTKKAKLGLRNVRLTAL